MDLNKYLIRYYCKSKNIHSFEEYLSMHEDVSTYFKYKDKYHLYHLVDINIPIQETLTSIREEVYKIYHDHKENSTRYKIHDESKDKELIPDFDEKCNEVYGYILSQKKILEHQVLTDTKLIVKIPLRIADIANALILYSLEKKTGCILYRKDTTIHIKLNMNINPFE